ncbi:hypothetical protein [Chitinophaga sp. GbtcB8]|uniref:hypothetical protein n=1 Tax=Chitinophaga sp. GbtcB8 TaxID=2824753 RepID=UPI001C303839|nr:hypothetical protein [Chitinophaga sp. GbtcB8]
MSEVFKKILVVSVIALLVIILACASDLGAGMASVLVIPVLMLIAGLILLITKVEPWAKVFLISSGIVLLLGFSVCTAAFMMGGGINMH